MRLLESDRIALPFIEKCDVDAVVPELLHQRRYDTPARVQDFIEAFGRRLVERGEHAPDRVVQGQVVPRPDRRLPFHKG